MKKFKEINVYSYSLFEIGKEEEKLKIFSYTLIDFQKSLIEFPSSIDFFSDYNISEKEKRNLLQKIINEPLLINWLLLLIKNGKFRYVLDAINKFILFSNNERNIENGIIWTTENVDNKYLETLQQKMEKIINKKVYLIQKINKELIGGARVEIGDLVWDNTLRHKLDGLIMQITKKG